MTNLSFHLYQLQKIDLRIDQINMRLAKIYDLIHHNQALQEVDHLVKGSETALEHKNQELAELENAANSKMVKIEQSESALYKGTNKSPKELSDLQKEIASLKKNLSELQEQQFNKLSEGESLADELEKRRQNYNSILAEWEKSNQSLVVEQDTLKKEKEILVTERCVVSGQISPDHLTFYEKLRSTKNHIAVSSIEEESCSICGAEITAADIQKSKSSSSLFTCPSCGRILYSG